MTVRCRTAGLDVALDSADPATTRVLTESLAGLAETDPAGAYDVLVQVEAERSAFDVAGWEPLTRGAWRSERAVVLEDACSSGYDLHVEAAGPLVVRARRRSTPRDLALSRLLPGRHHLLVRAALLQYPALWWAGVAGRVPLHASVLTVGDEGVLLAGPGGTGKSTLLQAELAAGGRATCDNLAVSDGGALHGLLEPTRGRSGPGRRMPHGRREAPWAAREDALTVTRAVVLRRGSGPRPRLRDVPPDELARTLVAGTYAAGELRRYWAFAATLALGTGQGPAHPAIADVARRLAASSRCQELLLPGQPGTSLRTALGPAQVPA